MRALHLTIALLLHPCLSQTKSSAQSKTISSTSVPTRTLLSTRSESPSAVISLATTSPLASTTQTVSANPTPSFISTAPTPTESVSSFPTPTFMSMAPSTTTSPSTAATLTRSTSCSVSITVSMSPSDRGTFSVSPTSTRSRTVVPARVPDQTALIVVCSIFAALFAFLVISAFGALCKCLIWVETIGCGVGARPAIAGRYVGAMLWSIIMHAVVVPIAALVIFVVSGLRGAFSRTRMLIGFVKYAVKQTNSLPMRAPRLFSPPPQGFPREGAPGATFSRDTPLPWWDGDQSAGAQNCATRSEKCLETCGYDNDGFQTYRLCCIGPAAKCFSFGGQLLFLCSLRAGVQAIIMFAIISPVVFACIFVGAFFVHASLGVLQAFWASHSWRNHCYTAGPAFVERVGMRVGGAVVDALAASITLAPVLLLNALLNVLVHFKLRLSPLAIAWTQVLAGGIDAPLPVTAGREPTPSRRGMPLSVIQPSAPLPSSGDYYMNPIGFFPPPALSATGTAPSDANLNVFKSGSSVSGANKIDTDDIGVDVKSGESTGSVTEAGGPGPQIAPVIFPYPLSLPVLGGCNVCVSAPGVVQICNGGHISCMSCAAIIFRKVIADERWRGSDVPRVRTMLECPCAGAARVLGHVSCTLLRPSSNPTISFLLNARDSARLASAAALVDAIQPPLDDDVLLCTFCPGVRSAAGACVSCEQTAPLPPALPAPDSPTPAPVPPTTSGPRWPPFARWTGELAFVFPSWSLDWAEGPREVDEK